MLNIYKSETDKFRSFVNGALEARHWAQILFSHDSNVIDIGCRGDKIKTSAYGVDIVSTQDVDLVISPNDIYRLSEFEKLESGFQIVYSSHTLEHLQDPVNALRDWVKLLKKDGYIVLYLPDVDYYKEHNPEHLHNWTMASFFDYIHIELPFLELIELIADNNRPECYSFIAILKKKYIAKVD